TSDTVRIPAETVRVPPQAASPRETGRATMARPPETGRRTTVETGRIMDTDRTTNSGPNGGPRRTTSEQRRPVAVEPTTRRTEETRLNGSSMNWLWALPLAALAGLGWYLLRATPTEHVAGSGLPTTTATETAKPVTAWTDLQQPIRSALSGATAAL